MRTRIGVFGGTFDPPHLGHLASVQDTAHILHLDRVLFIPNRVPPHKESRGVSPVAHRLAMVELTVADNEHFEVSTIELQREGPSYTLDTLRALRGSLNADMFFLAGCDALHALHTWHRPDDLLAEFGLVIMDRPTSSEVDWETIERRFPQVRRQVTMVDTSELEISSADIRRRVREGAPIRYYVLPAVERYIRLHGLYREEVSEPGK